MHKRIKKIKLNKKKQHSDILLREMFYDLLINGKLEMVLVRAKILSTYADKKISHVIGWGATSTVNRIEALTGSKKNAEMLKLYADFIINSKDEKKSGFTSTIKTRYRKGDNSLLGELSLYRWSDFSKEVESLKKKEQKGKTKKKASAPVKKSISAKDSSKGKASAKQDNDQSLISRLSGGILGRKPQGADITKQRKTQARSGL